LNVLAGCCGWAVRGGRKTYYREFPAVEVQQTFYKLPKPETLQRWRDEAPAGFIFCMKAWQGVTHPPTSPTWRRAGVKPGKTSGYGFLRPTKEVGRAWELTAEAAKALDARVVVVQTPPNMPADSQSIKNVERFFRDAAASGFVVGWEPRGELARNREAVSRICSLTGIIHITDLLRDTPVTTAETLYTRLHGLGPREVNYSYRYTDRDLENLAAAVKKHTEAETAYVMFNNISMAEDAKRFKALAGV
jgi:uncharacterized protein YecE (DUF72 family)